MLEYLNSRSAFRGKVVAFTSWDVFPFILNEERSGLLVNSGYAMQNIVGEVCSTCQHLPTYTNNAGIIVKSVVHSQYSQLRIYKLHILANVTGARQIVIDDGITPKYYTVNLTAGVIVPVNLPYVTDAKSAKISFTDTTIPVGQIYCQTSSSCGCGGNAKPTASCAPMCRKSRRRWG